MALGLIHSPEVSPISGAAEQAEGLVVEQAVGRENGARVDVRPAGEVGEPAAGLLDEDLHRRRVPGLEVGLGGDLRLPRRYHAVAVVVAEAALARGRVHEALEPCPVPRGAQDVQARVDQERVLHRGARRDLDPFAIGPGALALARPEELARHRIVDHARRHLPVLLEGDQHGPDGDVPDEVLGPVDRVDDPAPRGRALLAELLAEEAAAGRGAREDGADRLLRLLVRLGDRGLVGLDRDLEAAPVVLHGYLAGGLRGLEGRLDGRVLGHSHSPRSSSTSLNTRSASTTTGMPPYVTCWKMASATSCLVAPTFRAA